MAQRPSLASSPAGCHPLRCAGASAHAQELPCLGVAPRVAGAGTGCVGHSFACGFAWGTRLFWLRYLYNRC